MFPASLAAWVPVFIAPPHPPEPEQEHRWCHPCHGHQMSCRLFFSDTRQLIFRFGLGDESSTPASFADGRCRDLIISRNHNVLIAIA